MHHSAKSRFGKSVVFLILLLSKSIKGLTSLFPTGTFPKSSTNRGEINHPQAVAVTSQSFAVQVLK